MRVFSDVDTPTLVSVNGNTAAPLSISIIPAPGEFLQIEFLAWAQSDDKTGSITIQKIPSGSIIWRWNNVAKLVHPSGHVVFGHTGMCLPVGQAISVTISSASPQKMLAISYL